MSGMKDARKGSRWAMQQVGRPPMPRRQRTRWRSKDLKGPLPARVVRGLLIAIQSLPARGPWPDIDEEAWWRDVLVDRRLRPSSDNRLSAKSADAWLRLDRMPCRSLTFACKHCRQEAKFTVAELMQAFGGDRNVRTIGREVLKCGDKRAWRESDCPIAYRA
jgi:hypothetical protein